jgi:3-oxoacyl-[acyl-carrier protein] reductase
MESSFNLLRGQVAIITGCNRGIGKGILKCFAEQGAVIYAVVRSEGSLNDFKETASVIPCYMDITDGKSVKDLIVKIKKEQGKLDILVNNAGVMQDAILGMITDSQIKSTFDVNVFAMINLIQYATKLMTRQKSGSIINMTSIMGVNGNSGQIVYSASKGAVISLTKSAAKELASQNIRVNAIAPGIIETDLLKNLSGEMYNEKILKVGMKRVGKPNDIAGTALFLASDLSNYVTGQIIGVDGSMSV